MAFILAGIQGIAALPALLRAVARDLGDDQDSLPAEIDSILMMDPSAARPMVVQFVTAVDPAYRRVGRSALEFLDGLDAR